MADDIKPRLRVPATAKKGEVVEVKTLITHPMETGQRKDADGKIVPRLIVNSLAVTYNDKPVLNAKLEPAVAANPYHVLLREGRGERHAQVHLDRRQQAELDGREQDRGGLSHCWGRATPVARLLEMTASEDRAPGAMSPDRADAAGDTRPRGAALRRGCGPRARRRAAARRRRTTCCASRRRVRSRCSTSPTCMPSSCRSISASRRPIIGVGADRGLPPHLVGEKLLEAYKLGRGSVDAYALACTDFEGLARTYGRIGGLDRIATLIKAIRAERGDKVLLLDGGDTWQGSYTALQSKGADMVRR